MASRSTTRKSNSRAPASGIRRGKADKMSSNSGWICLHRKLTLHGRFSDPDWLSVWIYLLLNATHKPCQVVFDGRPITLKPGQLVSGRNTISKTTGVHPSKVYRVLKTLKAEQQIEQQGGTKNSLFTVVNWELYQKSGQQIEQQTSSKWTTNGQQIERQTNSNRRLEKHLESTPCTNPNLGGEQQADSRPTNNRQQIEHKQQNNNSTKRELPTATRISKEKALSLLESEYTQLEEQTAEQWQRDLDPEKVDRKLQLATQIERAREELYS